MKVLKLKIYQESVCYKKPFAFKVGETYPLPPYSTVKGMLHKILNAEEYIPMSVSIQGTYEGLFNSYNSMYFYKPKEVTTMPLNTHMLYGVELVIHVAADMLVLEKILDNLKNSLEYYSLGRREDLARINSAQIVELKEIDLDDDEDIEEKYKKGVKLNNSIYIPIEKHKQAIGKCKLNGIRYKLNLKYEVKDEIRSWQKVDVLYVEEGERLNRNKVIVDNEDLPVFLTS
ncbi:type I-B CRISPR-associated protein Cas5b [Clostridium aciditolerans]|uniref:Type I-B CRISPR-associated protein Cas5 n=1 Tax=Clostridium aciditolerans TaxID=339861 RepID=A0A934I2L1_9CLOT|nr:type I-B CRISPR-associated protein Cas5b [Clostridium aciditolerans]MBI6875677.1 type I-B CRISPR-associated protein Cas5 [Clostridium aciditolerans]